MCPDCISVIAVAIAVATPPSAVEAFLGRIAERITLPDALSSWTGAHVSTGVAGSLHGLNKMRRSP